MGRKRRSRAHVFAEENIPLLSDEHPLLISDRVAPQREFPISDSVLLSALEISHDAIIACDTEQRILFWNRSAQDIYGWSATEALGQSITTLLHGYAPGKQNSNLQQEIVNQLAYAGKWEGELVQVSRHGKRIVVESRQTLVHDPSRRFPVILHANRDVTASRQNELHAQKQLELLTSAQEIGLWSLDISTDQVTSSLTWDEAHLTQPGEAVDREDFYLLFHPEDREKTRQCVIDAIQHRQPYINEFRVLHPERGLIWYTSYGELVYDDQGQATHLLGIRVNITRQKQIEEELKAANEQITSILESITDYFMVLDTDWRYIYVNSQVCRQSGKKREEIIGHRTWEVFPGQVGTELERNARHAMEIQQPANYEAYYAPSKTWYSIRLYPTPHNLTVYVLNITDRKQAELALQANEAKFRALMKANISPILIGSINGPIYEANDAYLNLIGYTREEMQAGKLNWRLITPPEYQEPDELAANKLFQLDVVMPYKKEYIHKSGKRVPVMFGGARLENSTDRYIGFLVDLTAQQELDRQREQFFGMVSHELRTPLTGISGSLQLAHRRLKRLFQGYELALDQLREKQSSIEHVLDNALRQTHILDRLISDLIESARLTEGKLTLKLHPCDLLQIVRHTVKNMRFVAPDHCILLEDEDQESIIVVADADRIGQVLTNYITNAVKYAPADRPITVGFIREDKMVKVWVRDQGPGITRTIQTRIWERFYQVSGVEDQSGRGVNLGLGLYVCRKLIEMHQGMVGVDSQEGKGSLFWFALPLPEPECTNHL